MLAHRPRRWPNIETTMGECLVFAGMCSTLVVYEMGSFKTNENEKRDTIIQIMYLDCR